jgi:hypothetical protein
MVAVTKDAKTCAQVTQPEKLANYQAVDYQAGDLAEVTTPQTVNLSAFNILGPIRLP